MLPIGIFAVAEFATSCLIVRDVHAEHGRVVPIETSTKVLGE